MIPRETLERMYWTEQNSIPEIANELNVVAGKVYRDMVRQGIPRRTSSEAHALRINKRIDTTPSENLAYVLGVLKGDGYVHIKKNTNAGVIGMSQTRPEFAQSFEDALMEVGFRAHTTEQRTQKYTTGSLYCTYGYSFKFVQWYKSLSFEEIETILRDNQRYIRSFIRGFFESEGTNSIKKRKRSSRSIIWQVKVAGKDRALYDLVERLLVKLGFTFKRYFQTGVGWSGNTDMHILVSTNQYQNYRFIKTIAPCIKGHTVVPTAKILEHWSKGKVIQELRRLDEGNGVPSSKKVRDPLRGATERYFGSWNNAVEAAGIR